jgi:hypothetical protein
MEIEEIGKIEILESNEMYVVLSSGGKADYQYIYREAAEVYWDNDKQAFKAPPTKKWSHSDWFHHIVGIAKTGLGISLIITNKTKWVNVPNEVQVEIYAKNT